MINPAIAIREITGYFNNRQSSIINDSQIQDQKSSMFSSIVQATSDGVVITVHVMPRASKAGIAGTRNGAMLVRLNAPPVDNAANEELIELFATTWRISRRQISVLAGQHTRRKRVQIVGITTEDVRNVVGG